VTSTDLIGGVSNSDFTFEVTTLVDCSTDQFTTATPLADKLSYEIGSAALTTTLPQLIDSKSDLTGTPFVCGPIVYLLYASDSNGISMDPLPAFVKFDSSTSTINIETSDPNQAGTHYILVDCIYQSFTSPVYPD
jgi:hypothetical protein